MGCSYYTFRQGDYYCIKKSDYVNSDVYYKFCRNYDYSDCPIYKSDSSGRCYLTSACVYAKGASDDCNELEMLRNFRDTWLINMEDGQEVISQYYEIAPKIVSVINSLEDSKMAYDRIYEELVAPCIKLIEQKKYRETLELYRGVTLQLGKEYLQNGNSDS